ncbi:MAG: CPBP family intramembrane metalloprotease, partial [Bacteroidales bacterium]|nr:CPBP family intramembrane metalloprotease [Bacteroidales bacterium]
EKNGNSIKGYFRFRKFKWYLFLIALVIGFMPFPILLLSYKYFTTTFLLMSWILVALINPFFEEIFWRGYMLEKGKNISFFVKSIISSLLFTLSHLAIWGVVSKAMLTKELIISVFIMGLAWSFIYRKSKSLVLPYFSHLLVDVFNCSVLAIMNLLPMINY